MNIHRGGIYAADLNPPRGTEPGKIRPVVVVQTDLLNSHHPSTLVCPITTNVKENAKYLRVHLTTGGTGLKKESDILVDQIRAIDNKRLTKEVGRVSKDQMRILVRNLQIVLDITNLSPD